MMRVIEFKNPRGQTLVGSLHGKVTKRIVIGCHGMFSTRSSAKQEELAIALSAVGVALLRFDFSGRGDSEGRVAEMTYSHQVEDLQSAIAHVTAQGAQRIGLFGSSMGGSVALLAAAREPLVTAVATLGAVAYPADLEERFPAAIAHWRKLGFLELGTERINEGFIDDALRHDVVAATHIINGPLLVLHGVEDAIIPPFDAHDIASAARNASLEYVDGAGHEFSNPVLRRQMAQRVAVFMEKHV